ncbi:sulfurtransferase TusA family protein [Pseudalkalibacillus berkeleyi]|uniref:Sulfurtransferase TusA family protein n=1 Tax=Pseudalkalibacillus berkeleyi TaxID=1069813 RepID=A0ABS9H5K1_9BACL|nr:sulfurtransferase TusA family protein [Pseudalkalibacillus berkeleyi]MCF6139396.1 sulfurtransferase TusA family protein [Pseudalkalibacillus berkeleyi]
MIKTDKLLDAKGLACPMPIVKTKKALGEVEPGQVLEVQATDKGSTADIQAWAKSTGHQYLGTKEEGDVLKHYLRKASPEETKEDTEYPHVINNEELQSKLENDDIVVLDVREPAEYAFSRIPGAKSIPLGELEERHSELNKDDNIHVVCRTGNRSDRASQLLSDKGFNNVWNVVPGMSDWKGQTEND